MDVFSASSTELTTSWKMGVHSITSSTVVDEVETMAIVVATAKRDSTIKSITFATSGIPSGSTVARATLTATAAISRTQGSATKGYKFDDAELCTLDSTNIASSAFEKDVTSKFAEMNGGTFEDLSIEARYRAKYMQFNGKYTIVWKDGEFVSQSYQYSTAYGTLDNTQVAKLTLSDLKITVYYTSDSSEGGAATPATKWQKCEVYVCVPIN